MAIPFDHAVAEDFIRALDTAASELRSQGRGRDQAAESALVDFNGGYARTFTSLVLIESDERILLAGVLEELSAAVRKNMIDARAEQQRREDLEAWRERERLRNASLVTASGSVTVAPYDPQPSTVPLRPQPLSAVFMPRPRSRTPRAGGDAQGVTSADPARLEGFARRSTRLNNQLEKQKDLVARSYGDFTDACAWVPQESVTFIGGWGRLIEYNRKDGDLIETIANAFRHVGTGTLPTSYLDQAISEEQDAGLLILHLRGMDPQQRVQYIGSSEFQRWADEHPMGAKRALDFAAGNGIIAPDLEEYGDFLVAHWQQQAMLSAGIDPLHWDPQDGAKVNEENILAVYTYYGDLYLKNPDLYWAGVANAMGPSFAGGMLDLADGRVSVNSFGSVIISGIPDPPGMKSPYPIAQFADREIEFYEAKLLEMQKEIFLDQGMQHQAYVTGGIEEIERMTIAGAIPPRVCRAWKSIDSGDPRRVERGNKALLYREQKEIIKDHYDEMRNRYPTGEHATWLMTLIGEPSIPDAKSFPEVFPYSYTKNKGGPEELPVPGTGLSVDNPLHRKAHVTTGLPDGNISIAADRWALIEVDTWPAFINLVQNSPQQLQEIVESDVGERIEEHRPSNNIPEILGRIVEGRSVEYES